MTKQTAITSCAILAMTSFLILPTLADNMSVTVSAPKVVASNLSGTGVYTETFSGTRGDAGTTALTWYQTGTSGPTVGSFTSTGNANSTGATVTGANIPGFDIHAADQYGGAGGTGGYFAVGVETGNNNNYTYASTLTLTNSEDYVGVWLSALDDYNTITIYNGSTILESFNAAQLSALIGSNTQYDGNPSGAFAGDNTGQQYAYLNIYDTTAADITSIVFSEGTPANLGYVGAGFELDNVTVAQNYLTTGGITGTPVTPEPGTTVAMGVGVFTLAGLALRRKYRNSLTI